ncbi:MAG TPA: head GIN domain-containing protein [Flavisolibacter sp.]
MRFYKPPYDDSFVATIQQTMHKIFLVLALVLAFVSCKKEKRDCPSTTEQTYNLAGFDRISAGETFTLSVKQGAAFSIKAKGCSNDLNDLQVSVEQNGTLVIRYNNYENDRYRVDFEMTLPILRSIHLSGAATGNVAGFAQQATHLNTVLSGTAKCTVDQMPGLVDADLSGTSELNLTGPATDIIAHLSGNSKLNAYPATVDDADIYTSGTAKAYVLAQKSLVALASGDSRIYYKGNPITVSIEQSGTAKVIKE